jgi:CTP synthase (UTP-ammonia lyase)
MIRIGVMGERDGSFPPHYRLESAVRHSALRLSLAVELTWITTPGLLPDPAGALAGYSGLWAAPGNRTSVAGALAGIRFAREGQAMPVRIARGSRAYDTYGAEEATEEYYCSHGINRQYESLLQRHGLQISGRDAGGEPRILELDGHAFYVATLFVPQTRSSESAPHPLITEFLSAARAQC